MMVMTSIIKRIFVTSVQNFKWLKLKPRVKTKISQYFLCTKLPDFILIKKREEEYFFGCVSIFRML